MTADSAFWNQIAEKYSQKPVSDPAAFERKIAFTLARITPQDTVLDIGCGTGSLALRLAESGAQIHGLDVSSEMVRIAKGKATAQNIANIHFHANAFDESFTALQAGGIDVVCAYSLLHLVKHRSEALGKVFRLLKPGGVFISSTPCFAGSWIPYKPLLSLLWALGKAPSVELFTREALTQEVKQAGFVDVAPSDVGAKPSIAFLVATKPQ